MKKTWKVVAGVVAVSTVMLAPEAFALSVKELESNADTTTASFGAIATYIAWFVAAILLVIMGWNIYKKSKNPNGNEGSVIMGCFLAAVALLGGTEIAGLGTSAVFDDEETGSQNIRVGSNAIGS